MTTRLAFVLSGGGSRGAMQAGALRALWEAGYQPDLVTGTSIGAANAAFTAVQGFSAEGVQQMEKVWQAAAHEDLLPSNLWWQTMRTFLRRAKGSSQARIREFAIASGISPELRFGDIQGLDLFLVATDLNAGRPVVFGEDPEVLVLDALLASMALPPWIPPFEQDGRLLLDGGAVSNLPVEAALRHGATEIIALDLFNPNEIDIAARGLAPFLLKLNIAVENRQTQLELELAEARGVNVHHIPLIMDPPVPFGDFRHSEELMACGYEIARQSIATWQAQDQSTGWNPAGLWSKLENWIHLKR